MNPHTSHGTFNRIGSLDITLSHDTRTEDADAAKAAAPAAAPAIKQADFKAKRGKTKHQKQPAQAAPAAAKTDE